MDQTSSNTHKNIQVSIINQDTFRDQGTPQLHTHSKAVMDVYLTTR